jgi:hypothetical protein
MKKLAIGDTYCKLTTCVVDFIFEDLSICILPPNATGTPTRRFVRRPPPGGALAISDRH